MIAEPPSSRRDDRHAAAERGHVHYRAHVGYLCTFCGLVPFVVGAFIICAIMLVIMLAFTGVRFIIPPEDVGSGGQFLAAGNIHVDRFDATSMLYHSAGNPGQIVARQSVASFPINFLYTVPGFRKRTLVPSEGEPLLRKPSRVEAIRRFETEIGRRLGYSVPSGGSAGEDVRVACTLVYSTPPDPTAPSENCDVVAGLRQMPPGASCVAPRSILDAFVNGSTVATEDPPALSLPPGTTVETAAAVRTRFELGGPLPCYKNTIDEPRDQSKDVVDVIDDVLMSYIDGDGRDELADADVEMVATGSGVSQYYITKLINEDLSWVVAAAVAVAVVILVSSRSLILTLGGIFHIMMSYLGAWAFYAAAGYTVFPGLLQMAVFIILGIGADDIFVFLDAWKRSHQEVTSNINESLAIKVSVVTMRAAKAMFVTSFTTFAAFFATAVSPVPAVSAFGIYTAVVVALNYIYVITWFPALVLIWHRWFEFVPFFTARPPKCTGCQAVDIPRPLKYHPQYETCLRTPRGEQEASRQSVRAGGVPEDDLIPRFAGRRPDNRDKTAAWVPRWAVSADRAFAAAGPVGNWTFGSPEEPIQSEPFNVNGFTFVERVFYSWWFNLVRLLRIPILLTFIGASVLCLVYATQLEPATESSIGLPSDNPVAVAAELSGKVFSEGAGFGGQTSAVCLVYGVDPDDPIDRDGVDPNANEFLGEVQFTDTPFSTDDVSNIADRCANLLLDADTQSRWDVVTRVSNEVETVREIPCFSVAFVRWLQVAEPTMPDESGNIVVPSNYSLAAPVTLTEIRNLTAIPTAYVGASPTQLAQLASTFTTTSGATYASSVGFLASAGGAPQGLRFVSECFRPARDSEKTATKEERETWEAWADSQQVTVDFYVSSMLFATQVTTDLLRTATIVGALVSLALVFVVMTLFGGNLLVSILTTLAIAFVLVFIFAYMVWRGWVLDFIESVALTVLVGISVDFTVHYGTAYIEAPFCYRQRKTRMSLGTMGTSILTGAITTLAAASFLFLTSFDFFKKFGEFIFVAIGMSLVVSNTFFMAMLLLVGPQHHWFDFHWLVAWAISKLGVKKCTPEKDPMVGPMPSDVVKFTQSPPSIIRVTSVSPCPPGPPAPPYGSSYPHLQRSSSGDDFSNCPPPPPTDSRGFVSHTSRGGLPSVGHSASPHHEYTAGYAYPQRDAPPPPASNPYSTGYSSHADHTAPRSPYLSPPMYSPTGQSTSYAVRPLSQPPSRPSSRPVSPSKADRNVLGEALPPQTGMPTRAGYYSYTPPPVSHTASRPPRAAPPPPEFVDGAHHPDDALAARYPSLVDSRPPHRGSAVRPQGSNW